jgi:hypothetical protein
LGEKFWPKIELVEAAEDTALELKTQVEKHHLQKVFQKDPNHIKDKQLEEAITINF